jgi:uncharacterized integral membrane protein
MSTPQDAEPPGKPAEGPGFQLSGGVVAAGFGIAALLTFMVQNRDDVRVHFLGWDFTLSVWLLTLTSAVLGAMVWFGLGVLRRHRRRKERRAARRQ